VPTAFSLDELRDLVHAVEETGRTYMLGETSTYYPCAVYCRRRHQAGDFGQIVYAEAEYYHDWDHGLYEVAKWRGGKDWRRLAGGPPMYYPTHSTSLIISVTGARMTHVSCLGFVDRHEDGLYAPGANQYNNVFSNETALFRMSDGSVARVNEFRRIGHPGTVRLNLHGTRASYEEQANSSVWVTKSPAETEDLTALLACTGVPAAEVAGQMGTVTSADGTHSGASRVHDLARLPKEFLGLPNGHNGSHQFLVDDFLRACVDRTVPSNNVWQAARYMAPGLVAHESALREGELLEIPDFGDAPAPTGGA
jgi:predicted dehydrogenase